MITYEIIGADGSWLGSTPKIAIAQELTRIFAGAVIFSITDHAILAGSH